MWQKTRRALELNISLLPLKIALFLYHGANNLHAPYLVLQGLNIGILHDEMTIVFTVIPLASFAGPPIAGYLADKLDRGKLVMICSICVCAILNTSLLFIDANDHETNETNSTVPIIVTLHCHQNDGEKMETRPLDFSFVLNTPFPYKLINGYTTTTSIDIPMNICRCENHGEFIDRRLYQLVVEVRDTNWVFINLANNSDTTRFCNYCRNSKCLETVLVHSFHQNSTNSRLLQKQQIEPTNKWSRPGLWLFILGVLGAKFCMTATFTLLDSCCIQFTEIYHGSVGAQKIFGVISTIIFSFVGGFLINCMTRLRNTGHRQYDLVFYGADFLLLCLAITVFQLNLMGKDMKKNKPPKVNNLHSCLTPSLAAFLAVSVFNGVCHFYIDTYFSVFMIEIGASDFLLSLSSAITHFCSIPFLLVGDRTVARFGYAPVISLVLLTYSLRMIGYSLISNPWMCLPLEMLKAFTSQFFAIAAGQFCAKTAPLGLLATLNGIQHACNFSIGAGLGNFWSSYLTSRVGRASGFQLMAFLSALASLLYYAFYYCCLQKREENRDVGKCVALVVPCNQLKLHNNENECKTNIMPIKTEEYI